MRHNNTQFAKFLDNQESRPEVQSKLSSLLITPVQRIPRYCLLLKQVIENTDEADPEYISLKSKAIYVLLFCIKNKYYFLHRGINKNTASSV